MTETDRKYIEERRRIGDDFVAGMGWSLAYFECRFCHVTWIHPTEEPAPPTVTECLRCTVDLGPYRRADAEGRARIRASFRYAPVFLARFDLIERMEADALPYPGH